MGVEHEDRLHAPALPSKWTRPASSPWSFFSSNMIKKYVREHKENPWDWIRQRTKKRRTKLRYHGGMHGRGRSKNSPARS